jgi:hypothetical protein
MPAVRGSDGQGVYVGINPHPYPVTASLPRPAVSAQERPAAVLMPHAGRGPFE